MTILIGVGITSAIVTVALIVMGARMLGAIEEAARTFGDDA